MDYLMGTDIGTSGTKTIIMDTQGKLIASSIVEYDVLTPCALWAEQWPDVWTEATERSMREAVQSAGIPAKSIRGACVSGLYGGSGIPLDANMKPVRPCLIWMDRRAAEEERWLLENIGAEDIYKISHNGTDPYYGYTKMLWIKRNEPESWDKIKLFLPPNAYAIYRLTGEIAIDYSSAGNIGGVFDAEKRCWSNEMLGRLGIPPSMMPQRLVDSSEIVGTVTPEAASRTGLAAGTPICAGGVDCVVATLGMGVFEPGMYAATIGTSMCAAFVHDTPINAGGLIEMPYVRDAKRLSYSFSGAATAGGAIKWFRDQFAELEKSVESKGGRNAYAVLDDAAEGIPPGSEGLIALPYLMGERSPVWDTNARGLILGLSLAHTRAHIYRAFLEAVAYSLRHSMEATNADLGDTVMVAGGAVKSKLWRQIIADVTGYTIICPQNDVEANLGDVMLAGIGCGILAWEDLSGWQIPGEKVFANPENHRVYNRYYSLYRSAYRNNRDDMEALAKLAADN